MDSFVVNVEERGWWIFKEEVITYRKDTPPKGISIFDWGYPVGMFASFDLWVEDLIRMVEMSKVAADIYLDSDTARTLMRFREGEFS